MSKQTTACERCAELEQRVAWLDNQLAMFDPIYSIRRELPSDEEAASLLRIVCGRYVHMREQNTSAADQVANFKCALAFVWSLTVTKQPTIAYSGPWWTGAAATWCSNARLSGTPRTLLPALIVSDVPYVLDHSILFVDPFRSKGTAVDRGAWRKLLPGGDLRAATPINKIDDRSIGAVKVGGAW
jgi:hypothetical protein